MISVEKFKEIIEDVSFSYIERSFRHPIGWIYETSCIKRKDVETLNRAKYVKKIAHKHGLRVSYNMVYSDLEHYDALKTVMNEVVKTMYVSPITWIPTEEFGFNKFCFGFFPNIEREEFIYDDTVSIEKEDVFEKNREINHKTLNLLVSRRIKYSKLGNYTRPIILDSDLMNEEDIYLCSPTYLSYNKSLYYGDDSKYPENMSPEDFAVTVLNDYNLLEYYIPEYNILLIPSGNENFSAIGVLRQRLNISSDIMFDSYPALEGEHVAFCIDTSRLDCFSKHHEFFRIVNL